MAHEPSNTRAQLALLSYAASALGRRRGRTLAIAIGLASAVALLSAVLFVTGALRAEAARARGAAPDLVVQRLVGGRPALLAEASRTAISALPGVARVTPRVWGYLFLPAIQGNITIIGAVPGKPVPSVALSDGRDIAAPGECILGRELARALGVRTGDHVRFPALDDHGPTCVVVGLFASSVSLYTSDVAILDRNAARTLLAMPDGQATDLAVDLTNPDESAVIAEAAVELVPNARVLEKKLFERVQVLAYGRRSGLVLGASIPALLALLVLAYDRASGLGAAERREIAVLKACGWSTADVLATKMYESTLLALLASIAGVVLGYVWAFPLGAPGLREALAGWTVLYPTARLTPEVTFLDLLGITAMITAPYVALTIGPSFRAATMDPMEALRASLFRAFSRGFRLLRDRMRGGRIAPAVARAVRCRQRPVRGSSRRG